MSDELLPYYDRELTAIRKLAGEFGQANPKVAGRLRITPDAVDDPHVLRMLEGVAFLAARVQHRLDDESPDLSDALLELLCPHLLAPVPSMTTVQLQPKPEAMTAATVARGTKLQTEAVRSEALRYQTCHEAVLWPLKLDKAKLSGLPLQAPVNPFAPRALGVVQLTLRTKAEDLSFADLGTDRLRFFIRGTGATAVQLLELLCTATLSIALADGPADERPTFLPGHALKQAGFEAEEAALPWPQRAFSGHRLLTEYFAFPEKFLYIELSGLQARTLVHKGNTMEVYIYLSRGVGELERSVSAENFVLGATPAVNLFAHAAEPVAMDGTQSEWLVVPDARRPAAVEVYSVQGVRFSRPDAPHPRKVPHFQRLQQEPGEHAIAEGLSWLASRRPAPADLGGTEVHLMLRDPQFDPALPADGVLSIDTLCCNRDLPSLLPFGGGHPGMRVTDPAAPASGVVCLTPPTATARPQLRERSGWRLVSHLALNHLGLTGGAQAAMSLREMLRLHDLRNTSETALALDGIVSVQATPGVARLPGARMGSFARGVDVALTFDPQAWTAGGLYLLAAVLERFFALQVSINGFVRTTVYLRGRTDCVASWPARSGTRVLL